MRTALGHYVTEAERPLAFSDSDRDGTEAAGP